MGRRKGIKISIIMKMSLNHCAILHVLRPKYYVNYNYALFMLYVSLMHVHYFDSLFYLYVLARWKVESFWSLGRDVSQCNQQSTHLQVGQATPGADTGFMKGGGTIYETLPEAVHRGA